MEKVIEKMIILYANLFQDSGHIDRYLEEMMLMDKQFEVRTGIKNITKRIYSIFNREGWYNTIDNVWNQEDIIRQVKDEIMKNETIIKVSKTTPVKYLAGSLAKEIEHNKIAKIRTIGQASLGQLIKAIIVCGQMIAAQREPLSINFYFEDIEINEKTVTSIVTVLK